jgi:hypothetical protein
VFASLYRAAVLATATGWCIVRTDLSRVLFALGCVTVVCFVVLEALVASIELAWAQAIFLAFSVTVLAGYCY